MELLCKNSEKWQNYLSLQAKLIPNQNIISSIIELMRRCLTKTHHNYIIDLLFVIVRFIIENINGHNEERIKEYTGSRIFQYSSEIIQRSLQRLENNFFTKNFIKEDADDSSDEEEDYTSQYVIDRSKKIKGKSIFTDNYRFQILVENVLIMVNAMIIPETSHMFIKEENKNLINDLMKLNYMQFYTLKYDRYSLKLLKKDSHLAKMYNINVGFQCIYLISKLFDNNGVEGHNYVQRIDKESLLYYYLRLGRGMLFDLNP